LVLDDLAALLVELANIAIKDGPITGQLGAILAPMTIRQDTPNSNGEKKETEIGQVPDTWSVKPFNDVITLQRGFDLPAGERADGPIPVDAWAVKLRVMPRIIRVQRMRRKWGSCSVAGTITLAIDLDDENDGFQDFVIVHELLHLKVPNHGRLFKALMTAHVPKWRSFDARRKQRRPN
jgi:hypothetical protein